MEWNHLTRNIMIYYSLYKNMYHQGFQIFKKMKVRSVRNVKIEFKRSSDTKYIMMQLKKNVVLGTKYDDDDFSNA